MRNLADIERIAIHPWAGITPPALAAQPRRHARQRKAIDRLHGKKLQAQRLQRAVLVRKTGLVFVKRPKSHLGLHRQAARQLGLPAGEHGRFATLNIDFQKIHRRDLIKIIQALGVYAQAIAQRHMGRKPMDQRRHICIGRQGGTKPRGLSDIELRLPALPQSIRQIAPVLGLGQLGKFIWVGLKPGHTGGTGLHQGHIGRLLAMFQIGSPHIDDFNTPFRL